jgi:hypothetical protein
MDASNEIVSVTAAATTPKTLPMKYKAMLFANMSFINTHVADEAMKELLFSKLPIFKTVGEQIAYFDKEADMKTVEQTIFKPMLKDQKQKEKDAMKPAPKKKKAEPKKVVEVVVAEVPADPPASVVAEKELEFETEYPDAKPTDVVVQDKPTPIKKKTAPRKKKEEVVVADTTATSSVTPPSASVAVAPAKAKVPRKKKVEEKKPDEAIAIMPDTEDYYMIPSSVIPEGKYWTKDENFRNGPIYANGKDKDGDSAPGIVVGRLEDGNAIFEIV